MLEVRSNTQSRRGFDSFFVDSSKPLADFWRALRQSKIMKKHHGSLPLALAVLWIGIGIGMALPLHAQDCKLKKSWGEASRYDCELGAKSFHVLKLKGNYTKTVEQQARLLAPEILKGPIHEVIAEMRTHFTEGSFAARNLKRTIFDCYSSRIQASVSREFLNASDVFAKSMKQSLGQQSPYSEEEYRNAVFAIEMSIALEGLFRRFEEDRIGVLGELTATCGVTLSLDLVDEIFSGLSRLGKMKMGCLGFVNTASENRNRELMHARNFDANLVETWNQHPTLFLIEEPGFHRYAAVATAGVIYPGGISGMNEHGISVSLHELSTTKYRTFHGGRRAEVMPFLLQRILRESASLDQAIHLAKNTKHFGAWTILVSDQKTDEVASIETSGDRTQVARRTRGQSMGQANHFVGSQMGQQAFSYSYGKRLESQSRLSVIEGSLLRDAGLIDLQWMINQLSSHQDAFEGLRAFGRTAVKAYNVMSTIAIPARNEFWFTIGDRLPAAHGQFVGASIDFSKMGFDFVGTHSNQNFNHIPRWQESLTLYVQARLAYERGSKKVSLSLLDHALQLAAQDGIQETTYRYIRGRLLLELGHFAQALQEFNGLWSERQQLHRHKLARVALFSAIAIRSLPLASQKPFMPTWRERLQFAEATFSSLQKEDPHFALDRSLQQVRQIKRFKSIELEPIDFVTVE
jgi:hypothetical protein